MNRICHHTTTPNSGIVRLGIGAFCRAHLDQYTRCAMRITGENWEARGFSLRSTNARNDPVAQQNAYSTVEHGSDRATARRIEDVFGVLVVPANPAVVLEKMAVTKTKIVSLTNANGMLYVKGIDEMSAPIDMGAPIDMCETQAGNSRLSPKPLLVPNNGSRYFWRSRGGFLLTSARRLVSRLSRLTKTWLNAASMPSRLISFARRCDEH